MSYSTELDPSDNPEAANQAVQSLFEPEETEAAPPPDTTVTLCGGYLDSNGLLHRTAVVRELNGEDEESFARGKASQSWLATQTAILERAVLSVGTIEPPSPVVLLDMLLGDRTDLLLAIRQVTYGDDIEMHLACPKCAKEFEVVVELSKDIKRRPMEDPLKRAFEVKTRKGTAEVRLLTGADQLFAWSLDASIPEQNTKLLQRALLKIDGQPVHFTEQVAKKMGVKDRQTIIEFLLDNQPGPLLGEVSVPCSACGESSDLTLSMAELFQG